jgi:hypothetical protein
LLLCNSTIWLNEVDVELAVAVGWVVGLAWVCVDVVGIGGMLVVDTVADGGLLDVDMVEDVGLFGVDVVGSGAMFRQGGGGL